MEGDLCHQVYLSHEGRVLAVTSIGRDAATMEVREAYRCGPRVIGGTLGDGDGFREVGTNAVYCGLLMDDLIRTVQNEVFMDFNNPGQHLRDEVLRMETGQQDKD